MVRAAEVGDRSGFAPSAEGGRFVLVNDRRLIEGGR